MGGDFLPLKAIIRKVNRSYLGGLARRFARHGSGMRRVFDKIGGNASRDQVVMFLRLSAMAEPIWVTDRIHRRFDQKGEKVVCTHTCPPIVPDYLSYSVTAPHEEEDKWSR
jgi:hypothetical protein